MYIIFCTCFIVKYFLELLYFPPGKCKSRFRRALKTNNTVDVTTETIFPFVRMVPSVFTGKYKAEYEVSAGV